MCDVGSNRLNQGPRCIRRGGGGSFQKRGPKPQRGGADRCYGVAGWPHLAASGPPALRCLPESSHVLFMISFVADKFHFYFALESLFSAFLEIDPGKYRIYKTRGNCQFKP